MRPTARPRPSRLAVALALTAVAAGCGTQDPAGPRICDPRDATTTIAVGETVSGTLASSDCRAPDATYVDYYRFSVPSGGAVRITMRSAAVDPFLVLYNADNGIALLSNNNGGGGTDALIALQLNPGTYVIGANSVDVSTGAYTLTLASP